VDAGMFVTGSWTIDWGPVRADGFEEETRCVIKRLGNEGPARIGSVENVLGAHSHHMIVYTTNDTVEQPEPFPCTPFVDTLDPRVGAPLAITQRAEELIELPQGVAYTIDPDQMIRVELHYINLMRDRDDVSASTTLHAIDPAEFEHEASFLFIGNLDVDIPPRSRVTLGPTYFPIPARFAEANFFSITGHQHQWGTRVHVATSTGPGSTETTVYEPMPFLWDEPETLYHDPPFQVPAGGGFTFTCEWDNMSTNHLGFGESANDEMCFFWTYYYPSQGAKVCGHTERFAGMTFDICCPGDPLCAFIDDALGM